jgi:hypothetical protein
MILRGKLLDVPQSRASRRQHRDSSIGHDVDNAGLCDGIGPPMLLSIARLPMRLDKDKRQPCVVIALRSEH